MLRGYDGQVEGQHPVIKSIKFLTGSEVHTDELGGLADFGMGGYEFNLPSLKGKTFEFQPGVNVIVGRNGCGKTSLLNVIRNITMCDGTFSSHYSRGHGEAEMHRRETIGYFASADLVGDYTKSCFNLRKRGDMKDYEFSSSGANMEQFMSASSMSEGQCVNRAMKMMMAYFLFGEENTFAKDVKEGINGRSFKKCVIDYVAERAKRCKRHKFILDYYERNGFVAGKDDPYWGWTMLFDEPDKGLDVFTVNELYEFITREDDHTIQKIVVLHNIGLIHKIQKWGKAKFIDLDNGYLKEVEKFFE